MSFRSLHRTPSYYLVYLAPLVHLYACFVFQQRNIEWKYMVLVDLPVSLVALALAWRTDQPVLWFGLIGGAWWYVLSFLAWRFIRRGTHPRPPAPAAS